MKPPTLRRELSHEIYQLIAECPTAPATHEFLDHAQQRFATICPDSGNQRELAIKTLVAATDAPTFEDPREFDDLPEEILHLARTALHHVRANGGHLRLPGYSMIHQADLQAAMAVSLHRQISVTLRRNEIVIQLHEAEVQP